MVWILPSFGILHSHGVGKGFFAVIWRCVFVDVYLLYSLLCDGMIVLRKGGQVGFPSLYRTFLLSPLGLKPPFPTFHMHISPIVYHPMPYPRPNPCSAVLRRKSAPLVEIVDSCTLLCTLTRRSFSEGSERKKRKRRLGFGYRGYGCGRHGDWEVGGSLGRVRDGMIASELGGEWRLVTAGVVCEHVF